MHASEFEHRGLIEQALAGRPEYVSRDVEPTGFDGELNHVAHLGPRHPGRIAGQRAGGEARQCLRTGDVELLRCQQRLIERALCIGGRRHKETRRKVLQDSQPDVELREDGVGTLP